MEKIPENHNLRNKEKQFLANTLLQTVLLIKKISNFKETYKEKKFHLKNKGKSKFENFFKIFFSNLNSKFKKFTEDLYLETLLSFLEKFGEGNNEQFSNYLEKLNEEDTKINQTLVKSDFSVSWILSKTYLKENFDFLKPLDFEINHENFSEESADSSSEEEKKVEEIKKEIEEKKISDIPKEGKKISEIPKEGKEVFNIKEEKNQREEIEFTNVSEDDSIPESISVIDLIQKHKIITKNYKANFKKNHQRKIKKN